MHDDLYTVARRATGYLTQILQRSSIQTYCVTIVILAFELDRIIGELKSNDDGNGIENVTQKVIWASSNFIALIATL